MGNSPQEVGDVDGDRGEKPLPLPLPTGSGGIVGGVVGIGRERPLPLSLHEERLPGHGSIIVNAHALPCAHSSLPLLFSSMLGVLAKIRGVLPALPLFLPLLFLKYAIASIRALALHLENCSLFNVLSLEAILKSGME